MDHEMEFFSAHLDAVLRHIRDIEKQARNLYDDLYAAGEFLNDGKKWLNNCDLEPGRQLAERKNRVKHG